MDGNLPRPQDQYSWDGVLFIYRGYCLEFPNSIFNVFLTLNIITLANGADPDEMPHSWHFFFKQGSHRLKST